MSYTVKNVSICEYETFGEDGKKKTIREVHVTVDCSGNNSILMGTTDDHLKFYCVPMGSPEEILKALGEKIRRDIDDREREMELKAVLKAKMIPIPKKPMPESGTRATNLAPRTQPGASPVRPRA